MNKTFFLAVAMLCGVSFGSMGADVSKLTFTAKSGDTWSFNIESLKMQPVGDKLVITPAAGEVCSLDLGQLTSALFVDDFSSMIQRVTNGDKPVTLYSVWGHSVGSFTSISEAKQALPGGVYVVKTETETSKLIIK